MSRRNVVLLLLFFAVCTASAMWASTKAPPPLSVGEWVVVDSTIAAADEQILNVQGVVASILYQRSSCLLRKGSQVQVLGLAGSQSLVMISYSIRGDNCFPGSMVRVPISHLKRPTPPRSTA